MTELTSSPTPVGTLLRLSVTADERRADLGVPGNVPVAELLPGLARTLGLLDARTVYGGYTLSLPDGRAVDTSRSLLAQGVEDGAVLSLEAGARREEVRVYDDVVEAVADAVEGRTAPWTARDSALSAVWAAVALLLAGCVLLLGADQGSSLVPAVAAVAAVLVLACGAVVARVGTPGVDGARDGSAGRVLILTAPVLAAVAGLTLGTGAPSWGRPAAYAGAGALVLGLAGLPAMTGRRELCAAPALVGLTVGVSGTVIALTGSVPGRVLAVVVAVVVAASIAIPWLALASTPLRVVSPRDDAEILLDPPPVDPAAVAAQYAGGHRLQLALRVAVAVLSLVATVPIVDTGVAGTLLLVACFAGLLLSVRQTYSRQDVLLVVCLGIVGLAATGVAAALAHPTWRTTLVVVIGAASVGVIGLGLVSPRRRVALGRLADGVEILALAFLLPLGVATAGLV